MKIVRIDFNGKLDKTDIVSYQSWFGTTEELLAYDIIDMISRVTKLRRYVVRRIIKEFKEARTVYSDDGELSIDVCSIRRQ